ncbi:MAG: CopD family protein [Gammaproteobacteria bacterium]|nr:CopD family protein [Gammaproteobacteria bacterium]
MAKSTMVKNSKESTLTDPVMFPALVSWDLASLIAKILWYVAVISVAGGNFSLWLVADNSRRFLVGTLYYVLFGSIIGFHAVAAYFLIQVGAANDSGLSGILDWPLISFYLGTSIGGPSLFRMATFLLLIMGQMVALVHQGRRNKPPSQFFFRSLARFNGACLLALLLSFQATGHITTLSLTPRLALVLHILALSLWIGTLYPLRRVTLDYDVDQVQYIMSRFGNYAVVIVGVLLLTALVMAVQLLGNASELIHTPYGISLLVKSLLVCGLLGVAALNRWSLVPNLHQEGTMAKLRNSITVEMILAAVIPVAAAYLSTVVGPGHG